MTVFSKPALGVCYYPEHWPEDQWAHDARAMADLGLSLVRIGEFAWADIEPSLGDMRWDWLERAIETLGAAGLKVILGTPTATPPKWLIDAYPDILAHDSDGRPRRFGSRRHYCFSSSTYRDHTRRIVTDMAQRFGGNDHVAAWQTDNEYGCHDTTRSWSPNAEIAFRQWLKTRYGAIEALNEAWGAVFWSQRYQSFDAVDLPNMTVTEPNPSHVMDFYRFSSDQVISYNRLQTDILRQHSPGRALIHNFMGFYTGFDHFKLGADIDVASWDSYPLGFLDIGPYGDDDKARYIRQGHPDFAAFHHDLYRGCARQWAVMEQQPGPVNWARHNPAPLPGMVRLWTHEAIAHGAAFVSYFRWRQAPFAQEQMHAGLLRPDRQPAQGFEEARQAAKEMPADSDEAGSDVIDHKQAPAALIFDYEAQWFFDIQPQGAGWDYRRQCLDWYGALRRLGVDVDIVPPGRSLEGYKLVIAPSLPFVSEETFKALHDYEGHLVLGARSGSKTSSVQLPQNLAPGRLQQLIDMRVTHSESFPDYHSETISFQGTSYTCGVWLDHVETVLAPMASTEDGVGVVYRSGRVWYLTSVPETDFLIALFKSISADAGVEATLLPPDIRTRKNGKRLYTFNYGAQAVALDGFEDPLPAAGVAYD